MYFSDIEAFGSASVYTMWCDVMMCCLSASSRKWLLVNRQLSHHGHLCDRFILVHILWYCYKLLQSQRQCLQKLTRPFICVYGMHFTLQRGNWNFYNEILNYILNTYIRFSVWQTHVTEQSYLRIILCDICNSSVYCTLYFSETHISVSVCDCVFCYAGILNVLSLVARASPLDENHGPKALKITAEFF